MRHLSAFWLCLWNGGAQVFLLSEWEIIHDVPGARCPPECTRPAFQQLADCLAAASPTCHGRATAMVDAPDDWDRLCQSELSATSWLAGFPNYLPELEAQLSNFTVDYQGYVSLGYQINAVPRCQWYLLGAKEEVVTPETACALADIANLTMPVPLALTKEKIHLLPADMIRAVPSSYAYAYLADVDLAKCTERVVRTSWQIEAKFEWRGLAAS
eukprot:Gregarina_sp_Pseudo_9__5314@NODE_622_length_2475_cov_10_389163_g587_i0_p1_GENE_NODE_622_length_2475_cov_10_389163_g587_i0NODE_622_length_2475_cov_10_389163_g587_i0_p1_ORF_typecomplete_len214_score28_82_NODE_622_length_2475_cov_10_389163_g587_i018022443